MYANYCTIHTQTVKTVQTIQTVQTVQTTVKTMANMDAVMICIEGLKKFVGKPHQVELDKALAMLKEDGNIQGAFDIIYTIYDDVDEEEEEATNKFNEVLSMLDDM